MDVPVASSVQGRLTIFFGTGKINRMNEELARRERLALNAGPAVTEMRRLVGDMHASVSLTESLVDEFRSAGPDEKLLLILRIEKENQHFEQLKGDTKKIVSKIWKWLED